MIRGRKLPAQTPAQLTLDTSIHNRFDVEVVDAKTKEVKQKAHAFNVVCNGLWTSLGDTFAGSNEGWFNSIAYGTGMGVPAETDTALFNQIGKMAGQHVAMGVDYKNSHVWVRKDISITETMAVGETLTEVGVVDNKNVLCTHAMLQDMNGNQISIEKTDTDIVNIYATTFVHVAPELLDVNNPVQISLQSIQSSLSILRTIMGHTSSGTRPINALPGKGRVLASGVTSNESVYTMIHLPVSFDAEARTIRYSGRSAAVCPVSPG